jgi:Domain of unknown function (DUF1929)/Kelch motif
MTRPRPRWSLAAATVVLAAVTAALIYACQDKPTEPEVLDARNAPIRNHLTILATGSTSGGLVTSSRGGISCTISYSPTTGNTTLTGTCGKDYKSGMVLTVTAAPTGGGTAVWSDCDQAVTENPLACQVTMSTARTITVTFSPPANSFALSVSGGASGSGTVNSSPAGISCTITGGSTGSGCSMTYGSGTSVTLSATASTGSYLKAWAGAGCETNGNGTGQSSGSCTLTMSQVQSVLVSFETDAAESVVGAWGSPITWPAVAIHAQLLPNGTVMTFGRMDHNPVLWDPNNPGVFGSASRPADFFCSGQAFMPDGRLLVTGGHSGTDNLGIKTAYLYDFATNTWTRGPDMQNGRWYPSTTTLASGELLTMSGGDTAQMTNLIPEVFQPGGTTGTWRVLSTASKSLPLYPMPFVAPDGRVFVAGPAVGTFYLNPTGTGGWVNGPTRTTGYRDYGSAVMYDAGKILLVGGGTPLATAEVIDLNAGTGWRTLTGTTNSSMSVARRQMNATLLADGKVLVTGGSNATGFNTAPTDSKVLAAELWDPATEKFTSLSRMTHNRLYHSTALLLPDGRVLSVGSGQPAASGLTDDYTAEIFSPPYLFKADGTPAARPNLDDVPLSIGYGGTMTVTTANPTGVAKATWIRISTVTHSFNMNQRMNYLTITARGTGTITLQAPANGNLAPPGHYMLFLVNSSGVPSVAKIVRIN